MMTVRHTTVILTAVSITAALAGVAGGWSVRALVTTREANRGQADALAVPTALATSAALGLLSLVPLTFKGLGFFGIAHLAYLGVVVTVPLLGLGLLALPRTRPATRVLKAAGCLMALPAPVGLYASHVEPHWLRVDELSVPVDPSRSGDDPVRIAVLADLQTNDPGGHERSAIDRLLALRANLILLPGDLFQGDNDEFHDHLPALRAQLSRLRAPNGVYFVRGDVDPGDWADRALSGTGVVIVDDEIVDVPVGDRIIRIGGNRLDYRSPSAAAVHHKLVSDPEDGTIRILLSHRPDPVLELPERARVDLTVAGHTHGGQIVVPGMGPPFIASDVSRSVGRGGLHKVEGNRIYVSPGVGLERGQAPQVRLLNRPAVTALNLTDSSSPPAG